MQRLNRPPFRVKLKLHAAGPVRPRTKHKDHKLMRADASITLPFVPYPGLYLTMQKTTEAGSLWTSTCGCARWSGPWRQTNSCASSTKC